MCELDGTSIRIRTHQGSGSNSGLVPIRCEPDDHGPCEFIAKLEVGRGGISVAAVGPAQEIIAERFALTPGQHDLSIKVSNVQSVRGLLIRNASTAGVASHGRLMGVVTRPLKELGLLAGTQASKRQFTLPLRRRTDPIGGTEISPAYGGGYQSEITTLSASNCAVIVMDAWATHPCEGWSMRALDNMRDFLCPALNAARSIGLTIIHSSNDCQISELAQPIFGETVIKGSIDHKQFANELRDADIHTLIYMGYSSNRCLMSRPIGIMNMWSEHFNIILVRDASIALESPNTYDGKWAHRTMVEFIEGTIGATITSQDLCHVTKTSRIFSGIHLAPSA